jgi:hypothetical protein
MSDDLKGQNFKIIEWAIMGRIQGGSDKSGIFKIFFKNQIAQLNIIQFF